MSKPKQSKSHAAPIQSFTTSPGDAASWDDPVAAAEASKAISAVLEATNADFLPKFDQSFFAGLSKLSSGSQLLDSGVFESVAGLRKDNPSIGLIASVNSVLSWMPDKPIFNDSIAAAMGGIGGMKISPLVPNSAVAALRLGEGIAPVSPFRNASSPRLPTAFASIVDPLPLLDRSFDPDTRVEPSLRAVPASIEVAHYEVAEIAAAPSALNQLVDVLVESVAATKAAEIRADRAERRSTLIALVGLGIAVVFGVLAILF